MEPSNIKYQFPNRNIFAPIDRTVPVFEHVKYMDLVYMVCDFEGPTIKKNGWNSDLKFLGSIFEHNVKVELAIQKIAEVFLGVS